MHKRHALFLGCILAGCGAAPQGPEPSLTMPAATTTPDKLTFVLPSPIPGPGRHAVLPVPALLPGPAFGVGYGLGVGSGAATTLHVAPATILGRSNAHLVSYCRNHVPGQCANLPAKLAAMRQLVPTWGDAKPLYRLGHGVTDGRADYAYMTGYHFEQCWDQRASYPYDDVRNGMEEAAAMGADQLHVVNFGTSDPAEAARYVSFLDNPSDPNRLAHPTAAGGAQLFELGNEIAMKRERGHDAYAPDETTYASRARQFAQAMRAVAAGPIQIGAVASVNSNWQGDGWSGGADTVRHILGVMGDQVDFLVFHGYPSWPMVRNGDLQTILAQNEWNRRKLEQEIFPAIREGGRAVRVANTEFSTNLYGDPAHARGMFGALYAADSVALAMNEDLLAASAFCFTHGENADSGFFYDDDPGRPTPIYAFYQLLARHWGDARVAAAADGLPSQSVSGANAQVDLPLLGLTAAASLDGRHVYLLAVSRSNTQDVACKLDWGFPPAEVTAYTLAGDRGWDSPTAQVTSQPVGPTYTFGHATITILEARR